MENHKNGASAGQKNLNLPKTVAFLVEEALGTGYTNWDFYNLNLEYIHHRFGIVPHISKNHQNKIRVAMHILDNHEERNPVESKGFIPGKLTDSGLLRVYIENKYSLEETFKTTNLPYPEIRKRLVAHCKKYHKFLFKGRDWNIGKKKKKKFDLFDWIKKVHKHFSLRVLCETINWSPKAVLDLCAQCNEVGYTVIAPKIIGADLEWLALYDPNLGNFNEARSHKKPKPRGGKQIFHRLLHQENPSRKKVPFPTRTRGKKNSNGAKRGYVNRRGGQVKRAPKLWGNESASERAAIMQYLKS